jgi:hypothetical protein
MAGAGHRKCLSCGQFFLPDHRNRGRQRYCSAAACRHASKAASQAAWLAHEGNADYFCGPVHVARVQAWRAAHPGYWARRKHARQRAGAALQDPLPRQELDSIEESAVCDLSLETTAEPALQDPWSALAPAITGLIAHVFDLTLQDDIDAVTRRLVQLGLDVRHGGRGNEGSQDGAGTAAAALGSQAVQLG